VRIVYITATFPFGRAESFVLPEVAALLRRGHEVRIVPIRPHGEVVHGEIEPVVNSTIRTSLVSGSVLAGAGRAVAHFGRHAAGAAIDMVAHGTLKSRSKNASVLPKSLWLAGLVESWKPDHIHAHWGSTTASAAMAASSLTDVPWSFTAHRWDIAEDNRLATKIERAAFVRAISENGRQDLTSRSRSATNIIVLHMGVALPAPASPPPDRTPMTVFVPGSLVAVKGHDVLFQAIARPEPTELGIRLVLAGDGPLRSSLLELAGTLGVRERVTFLGHLPHADVLAALARREYDLVALASNTSSGEKEGIPVALMEAMAHTLPVLATDTGGVSELIGGGAGMLVEAANDEALASALCELARDTDLRRSLALVGRSRIEEAFDIESVVDELVELFADSSAGGVPG
jgi:glycosyltransferase involved in cell wall biosynthesis